MAELAGEVVGDLIHLLQFERANVLELLDGMMPGAVLGQHIPGSRREAHVIAWLMRSGVLPGFSRS